MKRKISLITALFLSTLIIGCGVYSFSGSTLPGHLKSVNIPLFANSTLEPGIAEILTQELDRDILRSNLLRIVNDNGDATITGTITSYSNRPYTYTSPEERQVDVEQYRVVISADVKFYDNIRQQALFEGVVNGEGVYDFSKETEELGKQRAIEEMVEKIMQNSVQSW
ncbi:hypothetical protein CHISP_1260 [Chitinispirillum alkaliphilum]|nr:hypothetical protein CHISP_1260 [Chitinispirillum alkaliphilum]